MKIKQLSLNKVKRKYVNDKSPEKILLCNINLRNNFGGPSLLHGSIDALRKIFNSVDFVCYSSDSENRSKNNEYGIDVKKIPKVTIKSLFLHFLLYKLKLLNRNSDLYELFNDIRSSDFVIDLYGICFCKNIEPVELNYINSVLRTVSKFKIATISKFLSIKTIKFPASYGPIEGKSLTLQAQFTYKRLFSSMIAREQFSKKKMDTAINSISTICVTHDVANLMKFNDKRVITKMNEYITFSVSHQLARQLNDWQGYVDIITGFFEHVLLKTDYRITILPNELNPDRPFCDYKLAQELYRKFETNEKVELINTSKITNIKVKNIIANSIMLVGSRYHSCVASLSSGVPVLVIGWHYKYLELLSAYDQSEWLIPLSHFKLETLSIMFDKLVMNKEIAKKKINNKMIEVEDEIIGTLKMILEK